MADRRIWPLAIGGALLLHAAVLPIVVPLESTSPEGAVPAGDAPAPIEPAATELAEPTFAASIALINEAELGALIASRPAPFDFSSSSPEASHPMPRADEDRAGTRAAALGGGDEGGAVRETERHDREDLRAEIWNGDERAQVASDGSGRRSRSPEAVTRQPRRGFDGTTDDRRRARVALRTPRPGDASATGELDRDGTRIPERTWKDADPVFDTMRAQARERGGAGRNSVARKTTIADEGTRAADVPRRGRLVDALDASARSKSTDPAPFEMARPSAAGSKSGLPGQARRGVAPRAGSSGTASRRSAVQPGQATESVHASRTDPYFRSVYAAIDRHVRFPRDLARQLEQGVVVVRFVLNPDGRVTGIKLAKSSGFQGFDRAFMTALRRAAPFGKVPQSVLGGARQVRVTAPYKFANPLIR